MLRAVGEPRRIERAVRRLQAALRGIPARGVRLTWRGGELVAGVFAAANQALRDCQRTNLLASPSLTLDEPDRLAAVVSGPVILHQYLLANPANSTISELALWSYGPPLTAWPSVADEAILESMSVPLCTAYLGSCP